MLKTSQSAGGSPGSEKVAPYHNSTGTIFFPLEPHEVRITARKSAAKTAEILHFI